MTSIALDSCDWAAPGADRYTGTATAAIHAFATIPEPVQQRLVAKHEKRAYDDIVYIDRDTIRGKKDAWDPAIRNMHFGSRGKMCGRVDRSMWKSAQVESAVVYCDSGYCVAWPSVCGNWFVIAPQAGHPTAMLAVPAVAGVGPADDAPIVGEAAPGVGVLPPVVAVPPLVDGALSAVAVLGESVVFLEPAGTSGGGGGGGGFGGGGFAGGGGAAPTSFLADTVVAAPPAGASAVITPIPEPSTWATMVAGLAALGALARRRGRTER